jgi:hypothetical protein
MGRSSRSYYTAIRIASATYDDQTCQVTLTLARPRRMGAARWHLTIDTLGEFALRDDAGHAVASGARRRKFQFRFTTGIGRQLELTTSSGSRMALELDGPGVIGMYIPQHIRKPSLWVYDTTVPTSRLSMHTEGTAPAPFIAQIVGSSTVELNLPVDVLVGLLVD